MDLKVHIPHEPSIASSQKLLSGLVAAVYTPMNQAGDIAYDQIRPMVERIARDGVEGLFVAGSTGEGPSLTTHERKCLIETFAEANQGQLPLAVHVGHNSLHEARELAEHAESLDVDAIASIAPGFFKPESALVLAEFLGEIAAAAPNTPLYYYHFPARVATGIHLGDILEATIDIENFAGVKYTHEDLSELTTCREQFGSRYHFLFGRDELFLKSLKAGFHDFIGSTYNYASPLFVPLRDAFKIGNMDECERLQDLIDELLALIVSLPAVSGQKILMGISGYDCGPARCPLSQVDKETTLKAIATLRSILSRV